LHAATDYYKDHYNYDVRPHRAWRMLGACLAPAPLLARDWDVRVLSSALTLTVIVTSLTRPTPVERPFRFILVFADDTHAHHQLLNTGYHEKV
jgi:hypothetical protein